MTTPAASARGIAKQFGATRALDGVDFDVMPGEIHALVGENGAGKSTLVRILGGVHRPDAGEIAVEGRPANFATRATRSSPASPPFRRSCASSPLFRSRKTSTLGDPPVRSVLGVPLIDRAAMRQEAAAGCWRSSTSRPIPTRGSTG